jgi:cytochrome P450
MIAVLQDKHFDPNVYEAPQEFDASRYIKLAQKTGDHNHWLFVTTSPDHIGFGHGVHSCPGRFFAANEIKITLIFMVLRYDWKIANLKEMEKLSHMMHIGDTCILNPAVKIQFKRRESEIDLMAYT